MGRVSQHLEQKVYLSVISGLFQKKASRVVEEMPCKYSTEVSWFLLEILEKSKVIASGIP